MLGNFDECAAGLGTYVAPQRARPVHESPPSRRYVHIAIAAA